MSKDRAESPARSERPKRKTDDKWLRAKDDRFCKLILKLIEYEKVKCYYSFISDVIFDIM